MNGQEEFLLRKRMLKALKEEKDYDALNALTREDPHLWAYARVLLSATLNMKDTEALQKILDLPALDKTSPEYKAALYSAVSYLAANRHDDLHPGSIALLLDRIKDDQGLKDRTLRFVFKTVVSHGAGHPDMALAKLLVNMGADLDAAADTQEQMLEIEKDHLQRRIDAVRQWKEDLSPKQ